MHKRSGPIPCGGLVHPLSTHRVLLTGDAAGLVSPLTAGGIRLAFQYGRRAGGAIASYLQDGGADPGAMMARDYPRFGLKTWMRRAWSAAPPNAVSERNALHSADAGAGAVDLFSEAGRQNYKSAHPCATQGSSSTK